MNFNSEWLNLILGGGFVATIGAVYKGLKEYREGSWRRKDSAVADLERWRKQSDDAREWEAVQHQWWRSWAGRLEYKITSTLGPEALPTKEPYPTHPKDKEDTK